MVERTYESSHSFCSESTISEDATEGSENGEVSESSGGSSYSLDCEIMHRHNETLHWVRTGERKAFSPYSISSSRTVNYGDIETLPSGEGSENDEVSESSGGSSYSLDCETIHRYDQTLHWVQTGERKAFSPYSISSRSTVNYGPVEILSSEEGEGDGAATTESTNHVKDRTLTSDVSEGKNDKEVVEDSQSVAAIDEQRHISWKCCDGAEKESCTENGEKSFSADELPSWKTSDRMQDTTSSSDNTDCIDANTAELGRMQRVSKKREMFRKVKQLFGRCFGMSRKSSS